ncbi:MAG: hypothetical protein FWE07_01955 [Turicibacter sp.]|nr:hypothetical protein [Turicibacter sp.]
MKVFEYEEEDEVGRLRINVRVAHDTREPEPSQQQLIGYDWFPFLFLASMTELEELRASQYEHFIMDIQQRLFLEERLDVEGAPSDVIHTLFKDEAHIVHHAVLPVFYEPDVRDDLWWGIGVFILIGFLICVVAATRLGTRLGRYFYQSKQAGDGVD